MLAEPDRGRWQFRDLVTARPMTRSLLCVTELTATARALIREMIDDLIDLILRTQLATRARMPILGALLALLAVTTRDRLRFLPRLSTTLLTGLWCIS